MIFPAINLCFFVDFQASHVWLPDGIGRSMVRNKLSFLNWHHPQLFQLFVGLWLLVNWVHNCSLIHFLKKKVIPNRIRGVSWIWSYQGSKMWGVMILRVDFQTWASDGKFLAKNPARSRGAWSDARKGPVTCSSHQNQVRTDVVDPTWNLGSTW
jgi:hypothetical protein